MGSSVLTLSIFSHGLKVSKPGNFKDFYAYAFRYCLTGIVMYCLLFFS